MFNIVEHKNTVEISDNASHIFINKDELNSLIYKLGYIYQDMNVVR
jgi:hypothetical protein